MNETLPSIATLGPPSTKLATTVLLSSLRSIATAIIITTKLINLPAYRCPFYVNTASTAAAPVVIIVDVLSRSGSC